MTMQCETNVGREDSLAIHASLHNLNSQSCFCLYHPEGRVERLENSCSNKKGGNVDRDDSEMFTDNSHVPLELAGGVHVHGFGRLDVVHTGSEL